MHISRTIKKIVGPDIIPDPTMLVRPRRREWTLAAIIILDTRKNLSESMTVLQNDSDDIVQNNFD